MFFSKYDAGYLMLPGSACSDMLHQLERHVYLETAKGKAGFGSDWFILERRGLANPLLRHFNSCTAQSSNNSDASWK